jgi:hypothetical protein
LVRGLGFENTTIDIFLALGLVFKSDIVSEGGYRKFIDTIYLGIDIYKKYTKDYSRLDDIADIDDRVITQYYLYILDNIKEKMVRQ